ncbi:hypothetical protein OG782_36970 [Streptomyces sp. NBC_00876]|uniref:hypothetical protein n=1 Tax=Streptomyces sp. NBC_00876 TaxID=2975853 RepID=UPI0038697CDB|nr:hypothetical protein OG782_36970 [Streptomyces sp. NBC_00876]
MPRQRGGNALHDLLSGTLLRLCEGEEQRPVGELRDVRLRSGGPLHGRVDEGETWAVDVDVLGLEVSEHDGVLAGRYGTGHPDQSPHCDPREFHDLLTLVFREAAVPAERVKVGPRSRR